METRTAYVAPSDLRRGDIILHTNWGATSAATSVKRYAILLVDRTDGRGIVRLFVQDTDGSEHRRSIRYTAGEHVIREYIPVLSMLGDE